MVKIDTINKYFEKLIIDLTFEANRDFKFSNEKWAKVCDHMETVLPEIVSKRHGLNELQLADITDNILGEYTKVLSSKSLTAPSMTMIM